MAIEGHCARSSFRPLRVPALALVLLASAACSPRAPEADRAKPSDGSESYKIVRVRLRDALPIDGYEDFVVGWMLGTEIKEVWGRPVGLLVLEDGSLLVSDDGGSKIWRITYRPPA